MKRGITVAMILAAIVGLSAAGYVFLGKARAPEKPNYQVVTVERGDVRAVVSASGIIDPERQVSLRFKAVGVVSKVYVEPGDRVEAGEVLAELQADELDLAVRQAEIALAISQARLDQLLAGASEEEIAAAEAALASALANYERITNGPGQAEVAAARASLASAQKNLEKLLRGPTEDEVATAKANLERARIALERAQSEYDKVSWIGAVGALPQALALEQATIDYEAALAAYRLATQGATEAQIEAARAQVAQAEASLKRLLDSPTDAELAGAEAQVAQARAQLQRLVTGPSQEEVRIAQAQVEQARVSLEQARLQRENAILRAPFAGVVAEVNLQVGEQVQAALPAVVLLDDSAFHITVTVDEMDITAVQEGQEAEILLDALPNRTLKGHVARISPAAAQTAGVTGYLVRVNLDTPDPALRPGMNAAVDIVTAHAEDVLVIPNRAIQFDRRTNKTFVEKVVGTNLVRTEVQLGVQGDQVSQVLSGLQEGDQVAIRSVSSLQQLRAVLER
ncbi:MAG: efflux RND transporter periplasmic adaptor subunit [Anaerolineae bacterium]